jgi:GDP-4-dehydro-6-deoxy-D-mannose reductase
MKALITGLSGFVGSHLAEFLLKKDFEVYGIIRWRSNRENIRHIENELTLFEGDVRDLSSVKQIISDVKPDRIYHLAAQSFVPTSWTAPQETITSNIVGQLNVLEAVRDLKFPIRILAVGSSEEYGLVYENEIPITENNPLRPLSPYGVSKVGQDLLGFQYFHSYGMHIIRTRAFNHTGPRRGEVFVTSSFCKQAVLIEKGKQEPVVKVGNLQAKRDFTDVRDVVRAYWLALEKGRPGEVYNICSGISWVIEDLLDKILEIAGLKVTKEPDPTRLRPSDVKILQGSHDKFTNETGWKPEIPMEQTIRDLLDYWRERV